jgi:site-specific DNA-methyltransferase (adenine-specific)
MRTYTHAHPRNLIDVARDHGTEMFMPTQKPIALMEYLVRTFTNEGDLVLDNCSGACSTGVACVNLNRKFIGIEKKRSHYEIGRQRIYGLPNIEVSGNPQVLGAQKTHFIRFAKQQRAIQAAIKKARSKKLAITKTLIAKMVGISRQQISARYSHLFFEDDLSKPVSKSTDFSLYGIRRKLTADKVAAE